MSAQVRELWQFRHLIWIMTERNLRIRYKNSVLGIVWSMIVPLMQALIMTFVLGFILNAGPRNQSVYIFCALIPWMFFQTGVLDASQAILGQLALIKKVYFPREIPVIATTCANLIHLLISLVVFVIYRWVVMALVFRSWPGPPPAAIVFLPLVLVTLTLLTLGVSLIIAALNVFYEDVKFIVQILLQFLMYMTPIMYFSEQIYYAHRTTKQFRVALYHVYIMDPIAWCVQAFKQVFFPPELIPVSGLSHPVFTAPFDIRYGLFALFVSVMICVLGYRFFNSVKWRFTERS